MPTGNIQFSIHIEPYPYSDSGDLCERCGERDATRIVQIVAILVDDAEVLPYNWALSCFVCQALTEIDFEEEFVVNG